MSFFGVLARSKLFSAVSVISVRSVSAMAQNVPKIALSSGFEIPAIGLGTWKSEPGKVIQAVKDAIDVGYRHIDGAHVYGNEVEVGQGINAKIDEGVVKREDLFVTSKLWDTHHHPDFVVPACKNTLKDLGLNYLDLYLIHWPMAYKEGDEKFPMDANGKMIYSDTDFVDTWTAMEKLVELKLVRSIGLSNFNSQQIDRILKMAKIKPAVLQIECHPYLNQKRMMEFCKERKIVITAYSPLGSKDRPWAKPEEPSLLEDKKLVDMAEKLKHTPAQIVLRYQIQRGNVVIPKSVHKNRIEENFNIFNFGLSDEDMTCIDSFNINARFCPESSSTDHPHYPFNIEF